MFHASACRRGCALGALTALLAFAPIALAANAPRVEPAARPRVPLSFEPNAGQMAAAARFVARGSGGALFLLPGETVLSLGAPGAQLRMRWLGARLDAPIVAEAPLAGRIHVVRGADPTRWRVGIPTFARVRYRELYPGIDAVYYGSGGHVEHDLVVAPGSDPTQAQLELLGGNSVALDADGDLVVTLPGRSIRLHAPVAYQEHGAERREVASHWVLEAGGRARIALGEYDRGRSLVIDPVLSYATYFGGNAEDNSGGIRIDASGIAFGGSAVSTDLPTAGGEQPQNAGGFDAFVAKLDPTGASLVYATYFGGSGEETERDMAMDGQGDLYLFGETTSSDLPTTTGAFDRTCGGGAIPCSETAHDTFVAKLDGGDGTLVYATYLGGSGSDIAGKIAVDAERRAYVAGYTNSVDLPVSATAYDASCGTDGACDGVRRDCFVAKLDPTGAGLAYLTYLGASMPDRCFGIDVDGAGRAVVVGSTLSGDFPATAGAYDTSCGSDGLCDGGDDAFVAMLDSAGEELVYATFLGGSGDADVEVAVEEYAWAVDTDASGRSRIVGQTDSADFPTPNGARTSSGGGIDAFVADLAADGATLAYATYLGGAGTEQGYGIAVDPDSGDVHVTGVTDSTDFPLVEALPGPGNACTNCEFLFTEAFVATLDGGDGSLVFSTFLGGSSSDYGTSVAIADPATILVLGAAYSADFPTQDPYQAAHGSGENYDAFIASVAVPEPNAALLALASVVALALLASASGERSQLA